MDPPAEEIPLVRTSVGATDRPSNTAVLTTRGSDNRDAIERGLDRAAVLARTTAELAQQMSNVRQQLNSENPPLGASTPISPPDTRTVTMEELEMRMSALFLRQLRQLGLIPGDEQTTCPPPPPASYAAQPPRPSAPLAAKTGQAVPFDPAQYWRRPVTTVTAAHPGPCGACACARAAECPPSQPLNMGYARVQRKIRFHLGFKKSVRFRPPMSRLFPIYPGTSQLCVLSRSTLRRPGLR